MKLIVNKLHVKQLPDSNIEYYEFRIKGFKYTITNYGAIDPNTLHVPFLHQLPNEIVKIELLKNYLGKIGIGFYVGESENPVIRNNNALMCVYINRIFLDIRN